MLHSLDAALKHINNFILDTLWIWTLSYVKLFVFMRQRRANVHSEYDSKVLVKKYAGKGGGGVGEQTLQWTQKASMNEDRRLCMSGVRAENNTCVVDSMDAACPSVQCPILQGCNVSWG